jgi:predicted kinase
MRAVMLCGPPCSGKSTYLKTLGPNTVVTGTDVFIEQYMTSLGLSYKESFHRFYTTANGLFQKSLTLKVPFLVIDRTNLTPASRKKIVKQLKNRGYSVEAHYFPKQDIKILLERNIKRNEQQNKFIPESVIRDMNNSYTYPTIEEGFVLVKEIR